MSAQVATIDGSTDCEGRDTWWWDQDVNAWTSFAFLLPAYVAARCVFVHRVGRAFLLAAALAALEVAGSALFHGGGGDIAQTLHDLPLIGLVGFIAGWHVGRVRTTSPDRAAAVGTIAAIVGGGLAWLIEPGAVDVVLGAGVVVTIATDLIARRRGDRSPWTGGTLALLAVALVTWVLGRSDSPLCDGASLWQWHGAWHAMSALVLGVWIAHAASLGDDRGDLRVARPLVDRALGLLTIVLVLAFHHSVAVIGRRPSRRRPTLIVVNHGNGFVDPIVIASILGRLPRFLAKAALWKIWPARPFLALAGVLPVYRSADGDRPSDNDRTFAACHHELAQGATVAIFPEGTTGDRGGLDRVRSGAARIALGALPSAPELQIVPIGLAFESRVETRSRAIAMIGEPIDVAAWAAHHDMSDGRAAAPALTDEIRARLAAISPDFESRDERELLRAVARVSLTDTDRSATFAEVEERARRLAATPPTTRAGLQDEYAAYTARLSLLGIDDGDLTAIGPSLLRLAVTAGLVALMAPLLAVGMLVHLPAIALVVLATNSVRATATKGTVRMLVGAATGLITWITAGALLGDGWAAVGWGLAVMALGALALAVVTPWWRAAHALWARLRVRDRRGLLPPVLERRAMLVDMVEAAMR